MAARRGRSGGRVDVIRPSRPRLRRSAGRGLVTTLVALALWFTAGAALATEPETPARIPNELLPFDMPSPATLGDTPRRVVAHWFLWPISADNERPASDAYQESLTTERIVWDSRLRARPLPRPPRFTSQWRLADAKADIRLAQAMGVDAFHVLIDKGKRPDRPDPPRLIHMLQAAHELDTGFRVAPLITCDRCSRDGDYGHWRNNPPDGVAAFIVDLLHDAGLDDSPALHRYGDAIVLDTFQVEAAPAPWWSELKAGFAARGMPVALMCVFNALGDRGLHDQYDPVCDIWGDWGARTLHDADRDLREVWADAAPEPVAATINQQDYRYRPGWEAAAENAGSELLRRNWAGALRADTPWAHLVTWNDYGEHSAFAPTSATQFAFYDLNAYYITWFKLGRPPPIERDALYFFHRIQSGPPWPRLFGDDRARWLNIVELVGFLREPGTLEIETAAGVTRREVPAGLQVLTAPLPDEGRPRFRLRRDGAVVVEVTSPFAIEGRPTARGDLVYRAGGSLRMAHGRTHPAADCARHEIPARRADACLSPGLGEPVWMAR